jgi:hypothetical protein
MDIVTGNLADLLRARFDIRCGRNVAVIDISQSIGGILPKGRIT